MASLMGVIAGCDRIVELSTFATFVLANVVITYENMSRRTKNILTKSALSTICTFFWTTPWAGPCSRTA